jgi:hypothetical protein
VEEAPPPLCPRQAEQTAPISDDPLNQFVLLRAVPKFLGRIWDDRFIKAMCAKVVARTSGSCGRVLDVAATEGL